jgi:hypothetical protein
MQQAARRVQTGYSYPLESGSCCLVYFPQPVLTRVEAVNENDKALGKNVAAKRP